MSDPTPIPEPLPDTVPPEARVAIGAPLNALQRRIADPQERGNKNSTNSSEPPSSDPPSVKRRPPTPPSGKERGGQPGHRHQPRALAPPEGLRRVIDCKPPECRRCGDPLSGEDPGPLRHQVAEVPPVTPVVDEYRLHRPACPRGRTATCAALPPGVPTGAFGPRLRAILGVLAGGYRLGKRPIRRLAFDLLGLSISVGMTCRSERQAAAEVQAPAEGLREYVRTAAVAHVDETSWWQGRDKAWLWAAVAGSAAVFTIATSRGADVARGLSGTDRWEVVVSDRFKSQAWIKRRRFRRAHLDRDSQAMVDRGGEAAEIGGLLLGRPERLSGWWHRVRDGTMARATLRCYVDFMRPPSRADLRRGPDCGCTMTAGTCRESLAGGTHLWTFVRVEGVEPTGNDAGRASRHGVIGRELSGGTDGEAGGRFVERMLSVVATCRRQDIHVLDYLTRCYRAHLDGQPAPSPLPTTSTAQAA